MRAYLGEGDGDAGVQLNVVGQLCELVLLLLERLQQAVDLLLGQHHSAVVLKTTQAGRVKSVFFYLLLSGAAAAAELACLPTCWSVFSQCRQAVET